MQGEFRPKDIGSKLDQLSLMQTIETLFGRISGYLHLPDSMKKRLRNKTVHTFMDNESCKYKKLIHAVHIRPDLQTLINEICKICIKYAIVPWFEHIPGKDNVMPDALSRNKKHPLLNLINLQSV